MMVSVVQLWLPILVSAAFVFVASSILHMFLPIHKGDLRKLPNEDAVLAALRDTTVEPWEYALPHAAGMEEMKSPEYVEKRSAGVAALITVLPGGPPTMGKELAGWFLFCLVVSLFAGYLAGAALAPGADYLQVFRFAGTTAFAAYALGLWPQTIWWKRPASTSLKSTFDGLVYALLTAGVFGWLWPGA